MWLYVCGNFFHGGLCSMHKSAKRVNIGRNSETENPIGPHFIARCRKKAAVTVMFLNRSDDKYKLRLYPIYKL
jgi:hypothetical protein